MLPAQAMQIRFPNVPLKTYLLSGDELEVFLSIESLIYDYTNNKVIHVNKGMNFIP